MFDRVLNKPKERRDQTKVLMVPEMKLGSSFSYRHNMIDIYLLSNMTRLLNRMGFYFY